MKSLLFLSVVTVFLALAAADDEPWRKDGLRGIKRGDLIVSGKHDIDVHPNDVHLTDIPHKVIVTAPHHDELPSILVDEPLDADDNRHDDRRDHRDRHDNRDRHDIRDHHDRRDHLDQRDHRDHLDRHDDLAIRNEDVLRRRAEHRQNWNGHRGEWNRDLNRHIRSAGVDEHLIRRTHGVHGVVGHNGLNNGLRHVVVARGGHGVGPGIGLGVSHGIGHGNIHGVNRHIRSVGVIVDKVHRVNDLHRGSLGHGNIGHRNDLHHGSIGHGVVGHIDNRHGGWNRHIRSAVVDVHGHDLRTIHGLGHNVHPSNGIRVLNGVHGIRGHNDHGRISINDGWGRHIRSIDDRRVHGLVGHNNGHLNGLHSGRVLDIHRNDHGLRVSHGVTVHHNDHIRRNNLHRDGHDLIVRHPRDVAEQLAVVRDHSSGHIVDSVRQHGERINQHVAGITRGHSGNVVVDNLHRQVNTHATTGVRNWNHGVTTSGAILRGHNAGLGLVNAGHLNRLGNHGVNGIIPLRTNHGIIAH